MRAVVHVESDLSLLESLAAGVQALECALNTGAGAEWLSLDACRALRASVETCGLRIDVASADLSGQVPPAREGALEEWLKGHLSSALERSVCLGATTLVLTTLRAGDPEITAGAVPYALALNAVYRSLMSVRAAAERAGMSLALAAAQHRFLLSPGECRDLIDEINAPNVGILLDITALASIGDVNDWIGTLRHRLAAVRIASRSDCPARNLLAALES
ncbi:MAG TPA: TIM barrel protein, partial [Phycisphaerae bacterium]